MTLSRFFNPRFLVLTSIVCCGTSCSDDDSKPTPTNDAGDESSTGSSNVSSSSAGGSSSTTTSSTAHDSGSQGGTTSMPEDAGDAGTSSDGGVEGEDADGSVDGGVDEPAPHDAILGGSFTSLVPLEAGTAPAGRAQLQSLSSGQTIVTLQAVGLEADTDYGAHVHALPCAYDNGGGHYKIDPTITATDPNNEIWPVFTTNADGVGYGRITVDHRVRGDALSVVVHAPDMTKYLCADLQPESLSELSAEGTFSPFAAQEELDENIEGDAQLVRQGQTTRVTINVTGLRAEEDYMAHVHALPCNVNSAGGHYKIDPTVVEALESNEVWPPLRLTDAGAAVGTVTVNHLTRLDAQSVVIHRQDGDNALKVACADLVYEGFSALVAQGELATLETPTDAGVLELEGEATLTRNLDGTTTVELSLEDLLPETEYGVHVHDLPCWLNSGGGHYKVDDTISATLEANEIWLNVTSDDEGDAEKTVSVPFLARPEAQSIVVHAPGGTRVGCIDLNP